MRTWELFRQALAGAARAKLRSALTALGIAIGCGALVTMIAFALGLQRQLETPLKKLGMLNDIHVQPKTDERHEMRDRDDGEKHLSRESPFDREQEQVPRLDDAAIARFAQMPGVMYAYPDVVLRDVEIVRGAAKTSARAIALPRELAMSDAIGELLVAGGYFTLDDAPQVVLTSGLLDDLGWKSPDAALNQTLEVASKGLAAGKGDGQFELQEQRLQLQVVGVIDPPSIGGFSSRRMRRSVLLPLDVMQGLPGVVESQLGLMRQMGFAAVDSYNGATVRAENPSEVPRIAEAIRADGYHATTVISQLEDMRIAFLFIESLLTAVGSVAMVVAGLGIANTLLMTVLERYEEIGLYKAIGATDGDVRMLFVFEAAVLGLAGSLGGLVLAAAVCWGLQWGVNAFLASEGVTQSVDVFHFPWWLLVGAVGFSTLLSILSGLYPASRAARVDPIRALRRA